MLSCLVFKLEMYAVLAFIGSSRQQVLRKIGNWFINLLELKVKHCLIVWFKNLLERRGSPIKLQHIRQNPCNKTGNVGSFKTVLELC
jgi:hypothetical protein